MVSALAQKASQAIARHGMAARGEGIITGLSGGADSVALLLALLELRGELGLELSAVHVHHGLRGEEADGDEAFCRALCERLGVPLTCFREDIAAFARENGLSAEEAGRVRRYALFAEAAGKRGAGKTAVAHNMNDNAETLLHRIIRGSGGKGLGGIPPVRGDIIRPLIDCSRAEIEAYLREKGQPWREDSTNFENTYTRNKIRNELIPYIERELNPNAAAALSRLAGICREEEDFLEKAAQAAFEECMLSPGVLSVPAFLAREGFIRRRVVRLALGNARDFGLEHIDAVIALAEGRTGAGLSLPRGLNVRKSYDMLIFKYNAPKVTGFRYEAEIGREIYIREKSVSLFLASAGHGPGRGYGKPCAEAFDADKIKGGLEIRTRKPGDVFTKKLKDFFMDIKLDRDQRGQTPLLCAGSDVLMIFADKVYQNRKFLADNKSAKKIYVYVRYLGENYE